MQHFWLILFFIQMSIILSNGLYECHETVWYNVNATLSLQQNNASICYGTFGNGTGTVFDAFEECNSHGSYLASMYTTAEFNFVSGFISSIMKNGVQLNYPIWIGLQRNLTNSSLRYWNDTCENTLYTDPVLNDLNYSSPSTNVYVMISSSTAKYQYLNINNILPYYICRRDENRCGSSPCKNNGTCFNKVNCFECVCSSGFSGRYCETSIYSTTTVSLSHSTESVSTSLKLNSGSTSTKLYLPTNALPGIVNEVLGILFGNGQAATATSAITTTTTATTTRSSLTSMSNYNKTAGSLIAAGPAGSSIAGGLQALSSTYKPAGMYTSIQISRNWDSTAMKSDSVPVSNFKYLYSYLMSTTTQSPTKTIHIRYLNSKSTSTETTTSYKQVQIFDGGGLPQWAWFVSGFAVLVGFFALVGIACFVCGSNNKPKSIPFT